MRKSKYGRLAVSPEVHRRISVMAAERGCSMKALTEQLLRLGLVAPKLAAVVRESLSPHYNSLDRFAFEDVARLDLERYDAALEGDPNA